MNIELLLSIAFPKINKFPAFTLDVVDVNRRELVIEVWSIEPISRSFETIELVVRRFELSIDIFWPVIIDGDGGSAMPRSLICRVALFIVTPLPAVTP